MRGGIDVAAPKALNDLVERYRDNISSYKKSAYNETQTRREFIDPLFELLGWDVANREGYAEAYKHVVHEDRVKVGGKSKAPDYSFRVGGVRKFFLEAKKPFVDITSDAESALQLRRYAWSAKLPLSILTNFENTAVYDCRIKPNEGDGAKIARIMLFPFEQLPARWDEVSDVFSLRAIQKGAFDRYAEDVRGRRGTATVDDDFLDEIERWREVLARAFIRKNKDLDSYDLNDAVQKTIDRVIFLRICEDRGIEPFGQLQKIAAGKEVYQGLARYFREADLRYNSGLFHFDPKEGSPDTLDTTTLKLEIEDKPLRDVVENLYAPKSPYEFSVIPADILGQVYERFLGKTIRVSGRTIDIDEKPDVKKAGGVYYTPTFVVRHIVKTVLGSILEGKTPAEASGDRAGFRPIRVVDPACGSGSFLIEVYQELLDWYLTRYVEAGAEKHSKGAKPRIFRGPLGDWRLSIAEKKRILLTHVYGVDVDPQAVEVTKLSLLLKVLEGESSDLVASQIDFLGNQRVLPDLGQIIKCGNTVISPKFYGLFDPSYLSQDQLHKINVFSWPSAFSAVFQDGGFDAVVGNPPYGATLLPEEKTYLLQEFDWQSYQLDTYLIFLEQSLRLLLRPSGQLGMIIPNPWLTNLRQDQTRKRVLENAKIREIVHFTFPVFRRARATVDTEIVIMERAKPKGHAPVSHIVSGVTPTGEIDLVAGKTFLHSQDAWRERADLPVNIFMDAREHDLAQKMRDAGKELSILFNTSVGMKPYQVGKGRPKQSRSDVDKRVFDSDRMLSKQYRAYLRGGDITRFVVSPLAERYIRYGEWLAEPRASAGFDAPKKILLRQTGDSLVGAIDTQRYLCMNNMHVLVPRDEDLNLNYVLALINSKALNWYYQTLNPEAGEALAEVKKANVDRLPIPLTEKSIQSKIGALALRISEYISRLRECGESGRAVVRRVLDNDIEQLNHLVYDVFNLSSEEREVIEVSQRGHIVY